MRRRNLWNSRCPKKLALYGSSSLSGVEHLRLLIGTDSLVDALLRHFGSLKALSRASFKELRQFLPRRKAEAVMAALSISNVVETEHALSAPLSSAEAIYRANLDMRNFHQEVLRVVLLDCKYRCIMKRDTFTGTVSECWRIPAKFSVRQSSIQHSLSRSRIIIPRAPRVLPKRI